MHDFVCVLPPARECRHPHTHACRELWIEELKVEKCVTEESVRRMDFGINPELKIIFFVTKSGDNGDLQK
jgi:hypothetical protein